MHTDVSIGGNGLIASEHHNPKFDMKKLLSLF